MQGGKINEGKQYTIADDKIQTNLLLRSKKGVFITPPYVQELEKSEQIFGLASNVLQTKNGEIAIIASQNKFIVYSLVKKSLLFEEACNYIYSITLSSSQRYLQVLDKIDTNEGKTIILSLETFKVITVFKQNALTNYFMKSSYPLVRFTGDDSLFFRYNSKTIEVYSQEKLIRTINSGIQQYFDVSLISTQKNYLIAAVYLDNKSNKGNLQLYNHEKDQPVYQKNINKAEQIKIKFSPTSNRFLIELQTYYDPTGKSYYGQYGLYLYFDTQNKITKVKTSSGPVHDFQWDRKGQNFLVISGFMPSEPVLFSKNCDIIFQFGKQHKNQIIWGNLGRFVCLAGFGNLTGEMQIWDMETKKRIGSCKSNSASYCEWAPDDRKIITAILTPRLRVDNCYKIFSYTGVLLHKANYEHTQLYQAIWIKNNFYTLKDAKGLSPGRKSGGEVKVQAKFKSFGASLNFDPYSNNFAAKKQTGPKLVPGQHPDDLPKKKKRNRHKNEAKELQP